MDADLHQRPATTLSVEPESDILLDEDYGVETEDNGVPLRPPKVLIDPGQFRYNRRISVVALPVFLLMLSMVGETYVFFTVKIK